MATDLLKHLPKRSTGQTPCLYHSLHVQSPKLPPGMEFYVSLAQSSEIRFVMRSSCPSSLCPESEAGFELTTQPRITLNFWSPCIYHCNAGIEARAALSGSWIAKVETQNFVHTRQALTNWPRFPAQGNNMEESECPVFHFVSGRLMRPGPTVPGWLLS